MQASPPWLALINNIANLRESQLYMLCTEMVSKERKPKQWGTES